MREVNSNWLETTMLKQNPPHTWFNFIYQTVITVTCTVKFPLPFVFWVIFGDEIIFRWPVGTSNHVLSCTFLPFRGNPDRVRRVCDVPNDHETSDVESSRNFCGCAVGTWHRPVKRGRKFLPIMWHILHFTSWKLCCNVGLCVFCWFLCLIDEAPKFSGKKEAPSKHTCIIQLPFSMFQLFLVELRETSCWECSCCSRTSENRWRPAESRNHTS